MWARKFELPIFFPDNVRCLDSVKELMSVACFLSNENTGKIMWGTYTQSRWCALPVFSQFWDPFLSLSSSRFLSLSLSGSLSLIDSPTLSLLSLSLFISHTQARYCCLAVPIHFSLMGWLRLVGSIKVYASFAKEPYKRDYILQKRHMILSILLTVATPYLFHWLAG